MHETLLAHRPLTLCAIALACAMVLGGCSTLPGEMNFQWPWAQGDKTAEAPQEEQAPAPGEEPEREPQPKVEEGAEESPSWNLESVEALGQKPGSGLSLSRAWMMAVANDPDYQAALSARAAAQTEIRLGRAAILPQVQAGYSRNRISGLQRQYSAAGMREGDLDYDSTSAYIQLQQPVFNVDRYAQFQGGYARAELGEAEFATREYEIAMRLTTAYMDAIAAKGALDLSKALAESLDAQAKTQDSLFERNEGDRVDAQETRARLAVAKAEVIVAEDALEVALRELQSVIGEEASELIDVSNIEPGVINLTKPLVYWLERAQANSAIIRTANAQVRVADTEVRRAFAGHLPTADLVLALQDADSENLDSLSQRSNTFSVGINVAIPIFNGGYHTANHARSRFERQQAEHELNQAREQTAAEVIRQYTALQGGAQRIDALLSAVRSGEESLQAARYGYRYGINSNLDVLRRQDSLFQTQNELLAARVAWLEARIALSAAVGEPISLVFTDLDAMINLRR